VGNYDTGRYRDGKTRTVSDYTTWNNYKKSGGRGKEIYRREVLANNEIVPKGNNRRLSF